MNKSNYMWERNRYAEGSESYCCSPIFSQPFLEVRDSASGNGTHPRFTLKSPIFLKAGNNEIALLSMTVGLQSYQTLFREGECFLHIVSLLNGNLDDANGETLVLGVLQTLTCLLASNDTSKPELSALVEALEQCACNPDVSSP